MNNFKDKLIPSMNDMILQLSEAVNMDRLHTIDELLSVFSNFNKLSIQICFKYSYHYSSFCFDVFLLIQKQCASLSSKDIDIVKLCMKDLYFIFTCEQEGKINNIQYEHMYQKLIYDFNEYHEEELIGSNILIDNLQYIKNEAKISSLSSLVDKFKKDIHKYDSNISIVHNNMKFSHSVLLEINKILNEIITYLYVKINLPKDVFVCINIFESSGCINIELRLDTLLIDINYALGQIKDLCIVSMQDVDSMSSRDIFNILISDDYFDNSELFFPLKKIKMQTSFLQGDVIYDTNQNQSSFNISFPCNIILDGFIISIDTRIYFIPFCHIEEIVCIDKDYTHNKDSIPIINTSIFSIVDAKEKDFFVAVKVDDVKFAFYCNSVSESFDSKIMSVSKNTFNNQVSSDILGIYIKDKETSIPALNVTAMKNKI